MGTKNLYIPTKEEHVIDQLESILKDRNQSLSEFFIANARKVVEGARLIEDIVLDGPGRTRKLRGRWVFKDRRNTPFKERGVILTEGGKLVYWHNCPQLSEPSAFHIFGSLSLLARKRGLLTEGELATVAAEIGEKAVEVLDI